MTPDFASLSKKLATLYREGGPRAGADSPRAAPQTAPAPGHVHQHTPESPDLSQLTEEAARTLRDAQKSLRAVQDAAAKGKEGVQEKTTAPGPPQALAVRPEQKQASPPSSPRSRVAQARATTTPVITDTTPGQSPPAAAPQPGGRPEPPTGQAEPPRVRAGLSPYLSPAASRERLALPTPGPAPAPFPVSPPKESPRTAATSPPATIRERVTAPAPPVATASRTEPQPQARAQAEKPPDTPPVVPPASPRERAPAANVATPSVARERAGQVAPAPVPVQVRTPALPQQTPQAEEPISPGPTPTARLLHLNDRRRAEARPLAQSGEREKAMTQTASSPAPVTVVREQSARPPAPPPAPVAPDLARMPVAQRLVYLNDPRRVEVRQMAQAARQQSPQPGVREKVGSPSVAQVPPAIAVREQVASQAPLPRPAPDLAGMTPAQRTIYLNDQRRIEARQMAQAARKEAMGKELAASPRARTERSGGQPTAAPAGPPATPRERESPRASWPGLPEKDAEAARGLDLRFWREPDGGGPRTRHGDKEKQPAGAGSGNTIRGMMGGDGGGEGERAGAREKGEGGGSGFTELLGVMQALTKAVEKLGEKIDGIKPEKTYQKRPSILAGMDDG